MPQIKVKRKYGPQYPSQHYAENMAIEIGDSLSRFIEVIHREFTSLKTKGIHFSHLSIEFITSNTVIAPNRLEVTIYSDITDKLHTVYGPVTEDTRLFFTGSRDWVEQAFLLIYAWHQELIRSHQRELKPPDPLTLFKDKP